MVDWCSELHHWQQESVWICNICNINKSLQITLLGEFVNIKSWLAERLHTLQTTNLPTPSTDKVQHLTLIHNDSNISQFNHLPILNFYRTSPPNSLPANQPQPRTLTLGNSFDHCIDKLIFPEGSTGERARATPSFDSDSQKSTYWCLAGNEGMIHNH